MRVLLVDDDDDARELLSELLATRGCVVSAHALGSECVAAAVSFAPDVAIVDLHLPDGDGLDVIRSLRSAALPHLRIVVITGVVTPDMRGRALAAGADAYMSKPISYGELSSTLGLPERR